MSEIDSLLEIDERNLPISKRILDRFSPELRQALEDAAVYSRRARAMLKQLAVRSYM
jgi:hypothetical protein